MALECAIRRSIVSEQINLHVCRPNCHLCYHLHHLGLRNYHLLMVMVTEKHCVMDLVKKAPRCAMVLTAMVPPDGKAARVQAPFDVKVDVARGYRCVKVAVAPDVEIGRKKAVAALAGCSECCHADTHLCCLVAEAYE